MNTEPTTPAPITKVSIIISKGSLEGVYPGLIMANGARAEGMEANLFFTFFGLDAIHAKRLDHIKVATVGNPAMHIPTLLGGLPGMSALATHMMAKKMEGLDIPPIGEFIEMISDTGASSTTVSFSTVRWLAASNRRAPSSTSPNRSSRTGPPWPGG